MHRPAAPSSDLVQKRFNRRSSGFSSTSTMDETPPSGARVLNGVDGRLLENDRSVVSGVAEPRGLAHADSDRSFLEDQVRNLRAAKNDLYFVLQPVPHENLLELVQLGERRFPRQEADERVE